MFLVIAEASQAEPRITRSKAGGSKAGGSGASALSLDWRYRTRNRGGIHVGYDTHQRYKARITGNIPLGHN